MADPKIRYDIEANATGAEEVNRLATELEQLDDAIDPALAERARAAAEAIATIGRQQAAITEFTRLKAASEQARAELQQAQTAAQEFARSIAAGDGATKSQAAQLAKLASAVKAAKSEVQASSQALERGRADLQQYGLSTENLAASSVELRQRLQGVQQEVEQLGGTSGSIRAFDALVQGTNEARDRLLAAERALEQFRAEVGDLGDATASQQRRLVSLAEAARQAQIAFQAAAWAQGQAAAQLRASGVETSKLASAQGQAAARARETAQASNSSAAAYADQARAAQASAATQITAARSVREGLAGIGAQIRTLQTLAGGVIGGQLLGGLAGDIAKTADEFANLQARMRLVAGEGEQFDAAFEGVFDVALRTNSALETTGTLVQRIAQAGAGMGVTLDQSLSIAESINQATQLSGGSAESADAAITQLIQGLQSGVLRGEEFNSVMEQAPRLAQALAAGLGVTTGELRKMAAAGQLTSQTVITALQSQANTLQAEFDVLPATVGRALTNLSTQWTRYVGEVDQANGISAAAARAINVLAENLSTLGTVLYSVGKAAAAYKAIQLAQTFLGIGSAARAATVEIGAMAAATRAAGAATPGVVGGLGRMASLIGGLKVGLLLGVVTNLEEIGTWLGESVAKWQGYGDAIEEAEIRQKAEALTAQRAAAEKAALAQRMREAEDAALGLSTASRQIISDFDGVIAQGDGVQAALEKVQQALRLDNVTGVNTAVTALDSLEQKGKITGEQLRQSLAGALDGVDLAKFEAEARAAFDGSEVGARRLAQALQAIDTAALDRAGISARELATGFSDGATAAINNVDALVAAVQRLGVQSNQTSAAISGSLDQALQAANTERAVQAVIARLQDLGRQGLITGDQLRAGLDAAQQKLDQLRPGINSLDEALASFGLKSRAELQATADRLGQSWEQIRNSTQVALADKVKAFEQYRDAVIAAHGGIESAEGRLQAQMLQTQAIASGLGASIAAGSAQAQQGVDALTGSYSRLLQVQQQVNAQGDRLNQLAGGIDVQSVQQRLNGAQQPGGGNFAPQQGNITGNYELTALASLLQKEKSGFLSANDLELARTAATVARDNTSAIRSGDRAGVGMSLEAVQSVQRSVTDAERILDKVERLARQSNAAASGGSAATSSGGTSSAAVPITINLTGYTSRINVASASDATALQQLLQRIQEDLARTGG